MKKNSINWFEINTADLDKAVTFYEKTLGVTLERTAFGGEPHAMFRVEDASQGVTGALVGRKGPKAGAGGVVIYLDAPDGVTACLARAKAAGGKEVMPHTAIGEHGFCAVIADLEGNHVGLHSMTA